MATSDNIEIRMRLLGARDVARGATAASRSLQGVSHAVDKMGAKTLLANTALESGRRSLTAVGRAAKYGTLAMTGLAAVAIPKAINASTELAKTTAGLNRNLNLSIEESSRWGAVAKAREIDSKALTMSFTTLSRRFVDAAHSGGTLLAPFKRLGITQAEIEKGSKDFNYALTLIAERFGEVEGGAKRQASAQQLLGRGYATLLPLFSEGTKGLREQLKWADKYGVTLDTTTNDALMNLVSQQRENKVAMLGLQVTLSRALAPAISYAQTQVASFTKTLNDPKLTDDQKFNRIGKQFDRIANRIIDVLVELVPRIADRAGHLGLRLAGALWQGFIKADTLGKLFIGAWFARAVLGTQGLKVVAVVGAKVGMAFARRMILVIGTALLSTQAGAGLIGTINMKSGQLKAFFTKYGGKMGRAFALGFITAGATVLADELQPSLSGAAADVFGGTSDENSNLLESVTGVDVGGPIRGALGIGGRVTGDGETTIGRPVRPTPEINPGFGGWDPPKRKFSRNAVIKFVTADQKVLAEGTLSAAELEAALA